MKAVVVVNTATGLRVGDRIGCAHTARTRLIGLLGRSGLETGGGIWISPSSGIHTIGMTFPIDVIGLDREFRVVRLWPHVGPFRIPLPDLKVRSVLELAAGEISQRSVQLGHKLEIRPCSS